MFKETFKFKDLTCVMYYGKQHQPFKSEVVFKIEPERYSQKPDYAINIIPLSNVDYNDFMVSEEIIGYVLHTKSILYLNKEDYYSEFSSLTVMPLYNRDSELYKYIFHKHLNMQINILNNVFNQDLKFEDYLESLNTYLDSYIAKE